MCELRSLIYRLVISKSVKVASSWKQEWQYGTVRYASIFAQRYGTVRYASIFAQRYGTLVRYAFFGMVRVRYASKIELKYGTLVRYGSRCEVRSTQIPNVPYRTAILAA